MAQETKGFCFNNKNNSRWNRGDAESATKLHLGRVGVDVLGKISGRKIDG
jgi:hypothetical protein